MSQKKRKEREREREREEKLRQTRFSRHTVYKTTNFMAKRVYPRSYQLYFMFYVFTVALAVLDSYKLYTPSSQFTGLSVVHLWHDFSEFYFSLTESACFLGSSSSVLLLLLLLLIVHI